MKCGLPFVLFDQQYMWPFDLGYLKIPYKT